MKRVEKERTSQAGRREEEGKFAYGMNNLVSGLASDFLFSLSYAQRSCNLQ